MILSSWMTSSVQSVQTPLLSCARWLMTCAPLTLNVTVCPGPPDCGVPQSTIHSQPATFVPARLTTMSAFCQPAGTDVVSVASVNPPAGTPGQELGTPNAEKSALARAGRTRKRSVRRNGRSQGVRYRGCTPGSSTADAGVLGGFVPARRPEGGECANRLGVELRSGAPGDLPRG